MPGKTVGLPDFPMGLNVHIFTCVRGFFFFRVLGIKRKLGEGNEKPIRLPKAAKGAPTKMSKTFLEVERNHRPAPPTPHPAHRPAGTTPARRTSPTGCRAGSRGPWPAGGGAPPRPTAPLGAAPRRSPRRTAPALVGHREGGGVCNV